MMSLGIMMYFLERFGFSAAPLVLGLILGPIAEANYIQGSMIASATVGKAEYFLGGPLNLILIALVILFNRIFGNCGVSRSKDPGIRRGGTVKPALHIASSVLIAAAAVWICWISFTQQPAEAFVFPRLISAFLVAFSLWTLGTALTGRSRNGDGIALPVMLKLAPGLLVAIVYVFWRPKRSVSIRQPRFLFLFCCRSMILLRTMNFGAG